MGRQPPTSAREPRVTYERVTLEIERRLKAPDQRGSQARCAEAVGMDSGTFRHTMNEREGARFSIEELATIAEVLHAPPGWPWLTWEEAEQLSAFRSLSPAARELLAASAGRRTDA
jgi:hypothetical protein